MMVTCPWCGTTYLEFQSNCSNCGGPLARPAAAPEPAPAAAAVLETQEYEIPVPPPAPRPISDRFAWRLLAADGWGVAGGIILFIGMTFIVVGGVLTAAFVTAFVGIPFLLLGLAMAGVGGIGFVSRYNQARRTVQVLQQGEPLRGQIASIERNYSVQVNGRSPWVLRYRFQVGGQDYQGKVSTLNDPDPALRAGSPACILYLPTDPSQNALYPHP